MGSRDFRAIVDAAEVPVLVDFWAEWCGPCQMAAPEVSRVALDMGGRALVLKINTEQHPELASAFGVRGIPTFVVLKGGQEVARQSGLVDHRELARLVERAT